MWGFRTLGGGGADSLAAVHGADSLSAVQRAKFGIVPEEEMFDAFRGGVDDVGVGALRDDVGDVQGETPGGGERGTPLGGHRAVQLETAAEHAAVFERVDTLAVFQVAGPLARVLGAGGVAKDADAVSLAANEIALVGVCGAEPVAVLLVAAALPDVRAAAVGQVVEPVAVVGLGGGGPRHAAAPVFESRAHSPS